MVRWLSSADATASIVETTTAEGMPRVGVTPEIALTCADPNYLEFLPHSTQGGCDRLGVNNLIIFCEGAWIRMR